MSKSSEEFKESPESSCCSACPHLITMLGTPPAKVKEKNIQIYFHTKDLYNIIVIQKELLFYFILLQIHGINDCTHEDCGNGYLNYVSIYTALNNDLR